MALADKFADMKKKIEKLSLEINDINKEIKKLDKDTNSKINSLNSNLKGFVSKKDISEFLISMDEKIKKINELSVKFVDLDKKVIKLSHELEKVSGKSESKYDKLLKDLKMDIITTEENLKDEIKKLKSKIPKDVVTHKEMTEAILLLSNRLDKLERVFSDVESVKSGYVNLASDVKKLESVLSDVEKIKSDNNKFRLQLTNIENEVQSIKKASVKEQEFNAKVLELNKKVESLSESKLKNSVIDNSKKIKEISKRLELLDKLQNSISEIKKELSDYDSVKMDLVTSTTNLDTKIAGIKEELDKLKESFVDEDELEDELTKVDERIEITYKDLVAKIAELKELSNKLENIDSYVKQELNKMNEQLTSKLDEFEDKIAVIEEGVEKSIERELKNLDLSKIKDMVLENRNQIKVIEDAIVEINLTLKKLIKLV